MVISQMLGGLGNQMFQYAAGRALSLERGDAFRVSVPRLGGCAVQRPFELLRVFNCPVETATGKEVRDILGWQSSPRALRILAHPAMARFRRVGFIVEPHLHYWAGIHQLSANCYLFGYWQSERYFEKVASDIRTDFTFGLPLGDRNAALAEQINRVTAVSIHVRRGDYATDPSTHTRHGLCSLEYYGAAIRLIAERVDAPEFFIFSDDIPWVKTNLTIDHPSHFIDHNHAAESYNDMRLMSLCRHHIIANSSFSWWGAWLNSNADKIVIAPRQWFADKGNFGDLIPKGCVTL